MSVLWDKIDALEAQLRKVEAERDQARAEAIALREELGLGLGDAMQRVASLAREVIDLRQERDQALVQLDEMRAAAGTLLRALRSDVEGCEECGAIATERFTWKSGDAYLCDYHVKRYIAEEGEPKLREALTAGTAIRTLRALLGGAS